MPRAAGSWTRELGLQGACPPRRCHHRPVEVIEARADKPVTKLRTTVTRDNGTVVLDGTAVCYTMAITAERRWHTLITHLMLFGESLRRRRRRDGSQDAWRHAGLISCTVHWRIRARPPGPTIAGKQSPSANPGTGGPSTTSDERRTSQRLRSRGC